MKSNGQALHKAFARYVTGPGNMQITVNSDLLEFTLSIVRLYSDSEAGTCPEYLVAARRSLYCYKRVCCDQKRSRRVVSP